MESNYSFFSRLLHRFILSHKFIVQTSFDIETSINNMRKVSRPIEKPVFISGLARAGTTLLMNQLHETGVFYSLSYRSMPFIMMPSVWNGISKPFHKQLLKRERSHKDGVLIDNNSAEAFEEIFWKNFSSYDYGRAKALHPQIITDELKKKFNQFVVNSLASSNKRGLRYLSKNNNNILRLKELKMIFPARLFY